MAKSNKAASTDYVPAGSVSIETVFSHDDFKPDVPEIVTFRDLADDAPDAAAPVSDEGSN